MDSADPVDLPGDGGLEIGTRVEHAGMRGYVTEYQPREGIVGMAHIQCDNGWKLAADRSLVKVLPDEEAPAEKMRTAPRNKMGRAPANK